MVKDMGEKMNKEEFVEQWYRNKFGYVGAVKVSIRDLGFIIANRYKVVEDIVKFFNYDYYFEDFTVVGEFKLADISDVSLGNEVWE